MAFYERQSLLDKTIESIYRSVIKDWELIIVDDGSPTPLRLKPDRRIRILRVEPKDKWYFNPCVPYNMAFREAVGDIILLQNPECCHMGDILKYACENAKPNNYLSFGCYAINPQETKSFDGITPPVLGDYIFDPKTGNGWYNHSVHRPLSLHFCSAIMRSDLNVIGGFDERYARGMAFDDNDFIRTVIAKGLKVSVINSPYVVHQFHHHIRYEEPSLWRGKHRANQTLYNSGYNPKVPMDYGRNTELFAGGGSEWHAIIRNYNNYYVSYDGSREQKIPKSLHFIWLGGTLPDKYLWIIDTWRKHHPQWAIKIWTDDDVGLFKMVNRELFDKISITGIKSALFRYEILYRYGGVYVDTDFECIKPLDDLLYLDFFGGGRGLSPILAEGLLACKSRHDFMADVIRKISEKKNLPVGNMKVMLSELCWDFLTPLFLSYIKNIKDMSVLFPDSFFYPMPNSFRNEFGDNTPENRSRMMQYIKPSTYCVHLWYTSWLPKEEKIHPAINAARIELRHKISNRRRKLLKRKGHA